uniref:Uncharacterized protein n=1 Tax=Arundo donax TaxID=35708 RepID=A0A0A9AP12_ARUDO
MISLALDACLESSLIRSLPAVLQASSGRANFHDARRVESISSSPSSQVEPDDGSNWTELSDGYV